MLKRRCTFPNLANPCLYKSTNYNFYLICENFILMPIKTTFSFNVKLLCIKANLILFQKKSYGDSS